MQYIQLADVDGVPVLIPRATVRAWLRQGLTSVTLTIPLDDLTNEASPMATEPVPDSTWLTVSDAARKHVDDVDGLTLPTAKAKISRACDYKQIRSVGRGRALRIDARDLDAWRLAEREADLKRNDE